MPVISGGSFSGGTITGTLAVEPTAAAGLLANCLEVTPPTGYTGSVFQVDDPNFDTVFAVTADAGSSATVSVEPQVDQIGLLVSPQVDLTHDVVRLNARTVPGIALNQNGAFRIVGSHAAPADGDVNAGDMYLWFDQTNGAAKLMVKAKSANGTVVAGSVALA